MISFPCHGTNCDVSVSTLSFLNFLTNLAGDDFIVRYRHNIMYTASIKSVKKDI